MSIFQTKLKLFNAPRIGLYNNSFHEWKLIPLCVIEKSFGRSFKFHSYLLFKSNETKFFPSFYREIILYWKKHLVMMTEIPSCILSQYLWYNANIQIKTFIHFSWFSEKNIMFHVLIIMAPLKNDISLRENTIYIRILIFNGYN